MGYHQVEKMDCRAKGEVIFCPKSPLLSESLKITEPINQRIRVDRKKKRVDYPIIQAKNSELS